MLVYVCLCNSVNDRRVAELVEQGATTATAIGELCGAGTSCGSCKDEIEMVIARVQAQLVEAGHAG